MRRNLRAWSVAQVVRELEFLHERAQVRTLEHLEIRARQLELAEVGNVVSR